MNRRIVSVDNEPLSGTTFLVACTKSKAKEKAKAKDLYISPSFKAARTISERNGDFWFIVSAKHGLLDIDAGIDPYDCSLASLPQSDRGKWASGIASNLESTSKPLGRFVFLGDQTYSEALAPEMSKRGLNFVAPFAGRTREFADYWLQAVSCHTSRVAHVERFYKLLEELRDGLGGARKMADCSGTMNWPRRGVYLLFENSERRILRPDVPRVTRIGTHGVSAGSNSSLWQRLRAHKGGAGKTGRHRSSILRQHVGDAVMAKSNGKITCPTWGSAQCPSSLPDSEMDLERLVSDYVGEMDVLWLSVLDAPSSCSDRAFIERNAISLLTERMYPLDTASKDWLGNWSPNQKIVESCMWNVDHVGCAYDARFLDVFEEYVKKTIGGKEDAGSIAPSGWHRHRSLGFHHSQARLTPREGS